jgi:tetratricopeptide (TPR) repeat protein
MSILAVVSRLLPSVVAIALVGNGVLAQPQPNPTKSNPLYETVADPLLPPNTRELSPFEQRRLREALAQMNQEAQQQLDAKNAEAAFAIWYRELRLQRELSPLEEINALGRVGGIAWEQTRSEDVNFINQRLIDLQNELDRKTALNPQLLTAFAAAYTKTHNIDRSLNIQQQLLANARQLGDRSSEDKIINRMGELYLAKFDYPNAAAIYEVLLDRAQAQGDSYSEGIYLQKLAEIYSQAIQPQNAVTIREKLIPSYVKSGRPDLIPTLKIAIAQDYEALKQPEKASQNYQEAFQMAWSLQQLGTAADALRKLGKLYETHNQADYALQIYGELIKVEQRSYNYYGLLRTYEQIGQIYTQKQAYPPALTAFQQALTLARSLNYRVDYYQAQVSTTSQKIQKSSPK